MAHSLADKISILQSGRDRSPRNYQEILQNRCLGFKNSEEKLDNEIALPSPLTPLPEGEGL